MSISEIVANYAQRLLDRYKRGAYECEDRIIVYGNDNYAGDPRVVREVELMQAVLAEYGLSDNDFGVSQDGRSWAIVTIPHPDHVFYPRDLAEELANCWCTACSEHAEGRGADERTIM